MNKTKKEETTKSKKPKPREAAYNKGLHLDKKEKRLEISKNTIFSTFLAKKSSRGLRITHYIDVFNVIILVTVLMHLKRIF